MLGLQENLFSGGAMLASNKKEKPNQTLPTLFFQRNFQS